MLSVVPLEQGESLWKTPFRPGLYRTLIGWFLFLALLPLALVGGISYYQAKISLEKSVFESLEASTIQKKITVDHWFHDRFLDLEVQATSLNNAVFLQELSDAFKNSGVPVEEFVGSFRWALLVDKYDADLRAFRRTYGYYNVFLMDTDGNILFSILDTPDLGTNLFHGKYSDTRFAEASRQVLTTGQPTFSDFEFYAPSGDTVAGFLVSAIVNDDGDKIGAVALEIPIDRIDKIMQSGSDAALAVENYLVGTDGLMRSNSAFQADDTILTKTIKTQQVLNWREGLKKGENSETGANGNSFIYAGPNEHQVLGFIRTVHIADVTWGLVAEIEETEALAEITRLGNINAFLAMVTIVVVLIISLSIANRIVTPIRILSATTHRVAKGQYDQNISIDSNNEIGDLALNFHHMLSSLKAAKGAAEGEDWFHVGQAGLSDAMRGEQDEFTLGKNVITYLARYLKAQIGAFYVLDDDAVLKLAGSYALAEESTVNEFRIGEGLVGQVALDKETLVLDKVPDDYSKVVSGVGTASPSSVVIMPILDDGQVKAVIELSALHVFREKELGFLESVVENIGIGVSTALSRNKVNDLLKKTQVQTEKLQVREEELKSTNDRLEAQAQDLHNSREQLSAQQAVLRQTNEELTTQGERIERQNEELQEAQRHLEERASELELVSRYKSEFLANMSHELRTPLNSLLVLSQLLMKNKEGNLNDKQVESIETIHAGGQDLLSLINDILDLSKVEAGMIDFVIESVNLQSIADGVQRQFSDVSRERGLELEIKVEKDLPSTLRTDYQRVFQIIKNLMSNAIKFTAEGAVSFRIFQPPSDQGYLSDINSNGVIAFSIMDTGVGIPRDKQGHIFEAFIQADGSTSRQYGGTGLGLSISRQFAIALGGEIQLDSTEGEGSTFTLYLPGLPPEDLPGSHKPERESTPAEVMAQSAVTAKTRPTELEKVRDDRREIGVGDKTLLIIEDDVRFAKALADLAREKNFKCIIAGEGNTGLHYADYYKPSAIILDIQLPGIDGWTIIDRLKSNPDTRHIPIHVISVVDNASDAKELGAVGFLTKPVDLEQIDEVLTTIEKNIDGLVKNLMIVTGDKTVAGEILELIGNGDVECTVIEDGVQACEQLKAMEYDCVVFHPQPSGMDTQSFLNLMKKDLKSRGVPILLYSIDEIPDIQHDADMLVRTVRSPEQLLDETTLFLHRIEANLPEKQRNMLNRVHDKQSILHGKKILLADDDMRNIFALSAALEDKGLEIIIAKNGREAIQQLDKYPDVDLVLMDIMMPEMDGYEAINLIRQQGMFSELPIIALTANAMKGDRKKCIDAGASDYLSKPVDLEKLISLLRVWLYKEMP